jgi:hypothetical protein
MDLLLNVSPEVVACKNKYSILLGGIMQLIERTWCSDAQRGETGEF